MTFYEAAVEVLKESGRPLHYKKITELAVSKDLLSHVGKTPEATMQAQLVEEAEKGDGATLVKVRAGVFALASNVDLEQIKQQKHPSITLGKPPAVVEEDDRPSAKDEEAKTKSRRRRRRSRDSGSARPQEQVEESSRADSQEKPDKPEKPVIANREEKKREPRGTRRVSDDGSLIAAAAALLTRSRNAVKPAKLAEKLGNELTEGLVDALLALDGKRCSEEGKRPQFRRGPGGWVLADGSMKKGQLAAHDSLEEAYRDVVAETKRSLAAHLAELKPAVIEEICQAVLTKLGFRLELLDRDSSSALFRAKPSRGFGIGPVAVKVYVDKAHAEADSIAALKGRLANYGCVRGVVISPRSGFSEDARTEAGFEAGPAVDLLDARDLASLALEAGVGVQRYELTVPVIDLSWFGA